MQISSNSSSVIKNLYMKKLSHDEVKKIKEAVIDNAKKYTFTNFAKNDFGKEKLSAGELVQKNNYEFQQFLYANGIDGTSVKRVSQLNFSAPSFLDIKA